MVGVVLLSVAVMVIVYCLCTQVVVSVIYEPAAALCQVQKVDQRSAQTSSLNVHFEHLSPRSDRMSIEIRRPKI